jgi:hypothetical protein
MLTISNLQKSDPTQTTSWRPGPDSSNGQPTAWFVIGIGLEGGRSGQAGDGGAPADRDDAIDQRNCRIHSFGHLQECERPVTSMDAAGRTASSHARPTWRLNQNEPCYGLTGYPSLASVEKADVTGRHIEKIHTPPLESVQDRSHCLPAAAKLLPFLSLPLSPDLI